MKQEPLNSRSQQPLHCYDAQAIAKYYRWRWWQSIIRGMTIFWRCTLFAWGLTFDKWTGQLEAHKSKRATQLRQLLTHLGPTFIKVGQALSTRPDLVPKDYLDELIKLQDQLPPFSSTVAFEIIQRELGSHPKDIYSEISPQPVAAASLGQVYQGRLYSGESVAIKVQRPNLLPIITLDLYLMRWAAGWIAPWLPLNLGHDLTLIVDEFGIKLFEEIDYINEGRNAERFAGYFQGDPSVKVPVIYWNYTSRRVLTLEWINGCKLTDSKQICQEGMDSDNLIKIGVTSGLRQLLEFGFFHADPHPGNLFALRPQCPVDGSHQDNSWQKETMAFIDFGMMDQLDEDTKENLVDAVVCLINRDYKSLAKVFVSLGFLSADTDIRPIIPALESVLGNVMEESVGNFNFKTITDQFSELMFDYPFRVPAKFALIIRSLITQEGLALTMNPNFKIVEVAYPYVAERLLTGESPQLRRRLIDVLFKDGKFQWQRLENLISIARSNQNFDLLPTAGMGFQYLISDEGKLLRRQLVLALTEDDRLHTEEVQRLWDLIKDDIQPAKLLNVAWSAFSEFSTENIAALLPQPVGR